MIDRPGAPNDAAIWYLIVSLPGTIGLIALLYEYASSGSLVIFLFLTMMWTILSPGMWVFPIVFSWQAYKLASGNFVPVNGKTYIGVASLIGLYLWWAWALKYLTDNF